VNWQPELPRKETAKTQRKKEWLLKEYQVYPEFRNVPKVCLLMDETFPNKTFLEVVNLGKNQ